MKTKSDLIKEYEDSYKSPPLLFTILMTLGVLTAGALMICVIYGVCYLILNLIH